MKFFTPAFFTLFLAAASAFAQTIVTETAVARLPEKTTPTNNWVIYNRNAGAASFVTGPGAAPLGCGSLQFSTPTSADKVFLYNFDYENTPLSAVTALSYVTYQQTSSSNQVPAINIVIDFNGPNVADGQAILVFEPVYNTDQGAVSSNNWQTWDAINGGNATWWSAQAINGVCPFSCYVTWSQLVANNPDAIILGGFGINQGSGNPGLISAVDGLTIGINGINATFNFEGAPANTYYADADGDGFGNPHVAGTACTIPAGFVTDNTDVNDADATIQRTVCYQGTTTFIASADVLTYLGNGATTGPCLNDAAPTPPASDTLQTAPQTPPVSIATYPNPTSGEVTIQLSEEATAGTEILILNANGVVIASRQTFSTGQSERFDLAKNGPGLYFIKIVSGTTVAHSKVLVQ